MIFIKTFKDGEHRCAMHMVVVPVFILILINNQHIMHDECHQILCGECFYISIFIIYSLTNE